MLFLADNPGPMTGAGTNTWLLDGAEPALIDAGVGKPLHVQALHTHLAGRPLRRVLLTHGDALCTDDRAYQQLRSTVRTRDWQRRFLGLPLAARASLARQARAGSQAHTARAVPEIMDVNSNAVEKAFRALDVRRMIHGHTHRPDIHNSLINAEAAQRIVLGAWYEQGSYLWYEHGRYELRELLR